MLTRQNLELWMEPGRRIVAGAGVLLGRVTQIKEKVFLPSIELFLYLCVDI